MAQNTSRKRARKFVPRDEVDWARAQQQAQQTQQAGPPSRSEVREARSEIRSAIKPFNPKVRHTGRNLAIAGGVTAGAAGTGYLIHRHNQKQAAMVKNLIDPFAKAYPIVEPVPGAVRVAALLPTGRHVGHANDLQHFKIKPKGHRQGPFSKGSVAAGLRMAAEAKGTMPLRTPAGTQPAGPLARRLKLNSKIPDASRQGRRLA